jgi:hypothetical protein
MLPFRQEISLRLRKSFDYPPPLTCCVRKDPVCFAIARSIANLMRSYRSNGSTGCQNVKEDAKMTGPPDV